VGRERRNIIGKGSRENRKRGERKTCQDETLGTNRGRGWEEITLPSRRHPSRLTKARRIRFQSRFSLKKQTNKPNNNKRIISKNTTAESNSKGLTLPLLYSDVLFLKGPLQGLRSHRLILGIVEIRHKWVLKSLCGVNANLGIKRQHLFKEVNGCKEIHIITPMRARRRNRRRMQKKQKRLPSES